MAIYRVTCYGLVIPDTVKFGNRGSTHSARADTAHGV